MTAQALQQEKEQEMSNDELEAKVDFISGELVDIETALNRLIRIELERFRQQVQVNSPSEAAAFIESMDSELRKANATSTE